MGEEVLQRKLETTPTWAVAVVCFVMLAISILIEHVLEELGKVIKTTEKVTKICMRKQLLHVIYIVNPLLCDL